MKLGGYTIGDAAWEDPASTIYSGAEPGTNRRVLIRIPKLTARPAKDFERLRRDHEIARALPPEVVIRPITLERFEGGVALVLEDAGARPLRQIIATRPLSLDEILTIGIGLAVATGQLHARRIIHKNITPDSVWWREDSGEVFLTDFSIASRGTEEGRQMQVAGQIEGQLAYTSPEQTGRLLRVVDHRADHYATGILLYRLLTGRLPFTSVDPIQLVHGHLAQIPPTPRELDSKIPATVSAIVMKLLAKAPDARYQSAHGLLADLRECATQRRAGTRIEEFPLGAHDSFETFQISQKLYGRDTARAALRACFTRAAADVAELVLVAGAPGAGKSVLVSDAQQSILEANGYYAGGKFDQFSQNVPYSAFAGALKELFDQLLTRPDAELSAWRERLHDALGNSGQVLVDVIPTLELITGPFPPVPSLPIEEARNRFNLSFRDLIRALASAEHPLVLFLDDLQWADAGSIGLLKLLAVDRQTRHLLVIGTYRDTEVGPDHRLSALLRELAAAGVHPTRIEVRPLAAETISDLLVDTLRCTRESARELAQLIEKKTEGNPFFVGQFIQFLYDEGLLQFDQALQSWSGDLLKIEAEGITDNVLDLMATKIARLDADARATLKLAACLGASFSLERASVVTERPREAVLDDLRNAWREGLLVSRASVGDSGNTDAIGGAGNPEFHFLHDRVQQAAYKLIPESELPKTHFRVGRLLQARLSVEELSASPFEVVNNLNRGLGLVSERDERRELAQLNLVAARKAQEGTAYEAALEYVRTGVSLLPDDRWAAHYDLTRDLHFRKLQCEFITGSFTEADQTFEVLQTNVTDPVDRASVVNQKIIIDVSTERSEAAIDLGVSALHDLGVHIPGHPNKLQLLWEFAKSKYLVGRRSPAELLGLPLMNDRHREAAVLLLNTITVPAYIARPDLMAFAAARTVNMSIQHGNSEPSVMGYVVHALVVGSGFGDYKNGFEFGRMSVALSERFNNVGFQCKAAFTFAGFVNWWRRPIETSLALHERAYRLALDAGDMQFAVFAVIHIITEHVYKGTSLEEVKSLADRYQPFVDQSGHDFARIISVTRQWVLALQGKTVNGTMTTDTFDEEAVFNDIVQSGNYSALSYIVWYRLQLAYLGGDFTGAHKMAAMQHEKIDRTLGQVMQADNYFYFGLTAAALSRVEPQHAKKYLKILKRGHTRLRRWAPNCPENFQDRFLLLDAELSAINGQSSALSKYDAAIAAAEARACTHNAAIANELAGRHALRQGQRIVAQVYLRAATAAFEQWGAHGKVQNLVDEFPDLALAPAVALPSVRREVSGWGLGGAEESMDFDTVLKTAQAISGEARPDRLLEQFLRLVLENAGAERGCFLVNRGGQLTVEATGSVAGEKLAVLEGVPAADSDDLCLPVVQYVARTRGALILENAGTDVRFASDEYVRRRQPKSVLCSPVMSHGALIGLLYLENNLTAGAFTPRRLQVLQLIAAEVAVALENTRLHETLQESSLDLEIERSKVDLLEKAKVELSKFVPRSVQRAIEANPDAPQLEKRAADVTVLFLDIAGYTRMCERLGTDRAHDTVQRYFSSYLVDVIDNGGEIVETAGDGLMILFQDPDPVVNSTDAARAALAIRAKTLHLNAGVARDDEAVVVNIGINSGAASLGATKFESAAGTRYTYTASGSTTNLAARVGAAATDGSIFITAETARRIGDRFVLTDQGQHTLKNVGAPVWLFSLEEEKGD